MLEGPALTKSRPSSKCVTAPRREIDEEAFEALQLLNENMRTGTRDDADDDDDDFESRPTSSGSSARRILSATKLRADRKSMSALSAERKKRSSHKPSHVTLLKTGSLQRRLDFAEARKTGCGTINYVSASDNSELSGTDCEANNMATGTPSRRILALSKEDAASVALGGSPPKRKAPRHSVTEADVLRRRQAVLQNKAPFSKMFSDSEDASESEDDDDPVNAIYKAEHKAEAVRRGSTNTLNKGSTQSDSNDEDEIVIPRTRKRRAAGLSLNPPKRRVRHSLSNDLRSLPSAVPEESKKHEQRKPDTSAAVIEISDSDDRAVEAKKNRSIEISPVRGTIEVKSSLYPLPVLSPACATGADDSAYKDDERTRTATPQCTRTKCTPRRRRRSRNVHDDDDDDEINLAGTESSSKGRSSRKSLVYEPPPRPTPSQPTAKALEILNEKKNDGTVEWYHERKIDDFSDSSNDAHVPNERDSAAMERSLTMPTIRPIRRQILDYLSDSLSDSPPPSGRKQMRLSIPSSQTQMGKNSNSTGRGRLGVPGLESVNKLSQENTKRAPSKLGYKQSRLSFPSSQLQPNQRKPQAPSGRLAQRTSTELKAVEKRKQQQVISIDSDDDVARHVREQISSVGSNDDSGLYRKEQITSIESDDAWDSDVQFVSQRGSEDPRDFSDRSREDGLEQSNSSGPPPFLLQILCNDGESIMDMVDRLGEEFVMEKIIEAQNEGRNIIGAEELGIQPDPSGDRAALDQFKNATQTTSAGSRRKNEYDPEKALSGEYSFSYRGKNSEGGGSEKGQNAKKRFGKKGWGWGRGRGRGRGWGRGRGRGRG